MKEPNCSISISWTKLTIHPILSLCLKLCRVTSKSILEPHFGLTLHCRLGGSPASKFWMSGLRFFMLIRWWNMQMQRRLAQNREAARKSRLKKKVWTFILHTFKDVPNKQAFDFWHFITGSYTTVRIVSFKAVTGRARARSYKTGNVKMN